MHKTGTRSVTLWQWSLLIRMINITGSRKKVLNTQYSIFNTILMRSWLLTTILLLGINIPLNNKGMSTKAIALALEEELEKTAFIDSVYNQMSWEQRLGQLLMIRAHSNKGAAHEAFVKRQIKEYHVGGIVFFQGTPEKQAILTNEYQQLAKTPLLVAMDAEWGLGMRLKKSTISYPRQLTLGAIRNERLLYDFGREIAVQLRRLGVHMNFAPVADVNNNPNNPVINTRSFGEDRFHVAARSYQYMKGMQDGGVLACAKHFPGHGDTDVDSHLDLPVITHTAERLDSIELYPFKLLSKRGIASIMVAHLHVPAIDDSDNRPTTLSAKAIKNTLQEDIEFQGLVITDAMEMQGVAKHFPPGEAEVEALKAGNDIILLPSDIDVVFPKLLKALQNGVVDTVQVERSVKKVIEAKYSIDLFKNDNQVVLDKLSSDLNRPEAVAFKQKLFESAITLVRNRNSIIPINTIDQSKWATLSIGSTVKTTFQESIDQYLPVTHLQLSKDISGSRANRYLSILERKELVVVSLHDLSSYASRDYGITSGTRSFLEQLKERTEVVLVLFGSPYALKYFDDFDHVLLAYEEDPLSQGAAADALVGANPIRGMLPVTASEKNGVGEGIILENAQRLGFGRPVSVGMSDDTLSYIDSLMNEAISRKATPGGVVLVAKEGKIVYYKAHGYHTYRKREPAKKTDLYDLASITKVAATTVAIMKLYEEGKIELKAKISNYLQELIGSDKENITIDSILMHRSGLVAWIPFYEQTIVPSRFNPRPLPEFYSTYKRDSFEVKVAEKMYMNKFFQDTMRKEIRESVLGKRGKYSYSDVGFYLLADLVERVSGKRLDVYLQETFYGPMGLPFISFNPAERYSKKQIPPTEEDRYYRGQRVQGYVHDMGAAMMGGVSGHAGLFSNAQSLAELIQMLLNGGYYKGIQFLQPETIALFTQRPEGNTRRGLGFDMKQLDNKEVLNMSPLASSRAFGHLGFTGTCFWADPKEQLIYILLTNRTYPTMRNNRWSREDFRPRIQSVAYKAIN